MRHKTRNKTKLAIHNPIDTINESHIKHARPSLIQVQFSIKQGRKPTKIPKPRMRRIKTNISIEATRIIPKLKLNTSVNFFLSMIESWYCLHSFSDKKFTTFMLFEIRTWEIISEQPEDFSSSEHLPLNISYSHLHVISFSVGVGVGT